MGFFRGGEGPSMPTAATHEASALPRRNVESIPPHLKERARAVEIVATNILEGEINRLTTPPEDGSSTLSVTSEQILNDPATDLFATLGAIGAISDGTTVRINPATNAPTNEFKLSDGLLKGRVEITDDQGNPWAVTSINGRKGETFYCTVDNGRGTVKHDQPVPRAELLRLQLLAEESVARTAIEQRYGPDSAEYKLVDSYLDSIKLQTGGTAAEPALDKLEAAYVDKLILETAKKRGMLTADDLQSFINAKYPELTMPKAPEGTTIALNNDQLARVAERERLLQLLDGKTIVDYETFKTIFGNDIPRELQKAKDLIQNLEERIAATPPKERGELQKQLTEAKTLELMIRSAQQNLDPGGGFEQFFNGVQTGRIPPAEANKALDLIRSGNTDGAIDAFIEIKQQSENIVMTTQQQEEFRQSLRKKGKISLYILLAMMASGYAVSTMALKQQ